MPYISGGSPAEEYSIPWQVRVEINGKRCGGTLISNRHVLTAAHCFEHGNAMFVVVGGHYINDDSDGARHNVCKTSIHPKWNEWTREFDFAILHLETPVEFGPRAVPACLPAQRLDGGRDGLDWMQTGRTMTVSGWGLLAPDEYETPNELYVVKVPGVSDERCKDMHRDFTRRFGIHITDNMLCAGDNENTNRDANSGDSGGLLCNCPDSQCVHPKMLYLQCSPFEMKAGIV